MRLSKNINIKKILGIIIFIIILFYFIYAYKNYQKNKKDNFECNFRNNLCQPLNLINNNFIVNRRVSDTDTTQTKDLIVNKGKYYTVDNNYYMVIDLKQPFGNGSNPKMDTDELYQLKQSEKYIWALNKGRDQINIRPISPNTDGNFRQLI